MDENEQLAAIRDFDRQYRQFARDNPGRKFGDFYVEKASESIAREIPHPTLGSRLRSGQEWSQAGKKQLAFLMREGLEPRHRIVDFGCGSLLVGQHLIRHLDPEHYWGLDITDVFIQMGVEQLPPQLLAERRPHFRIIDRAALDEVRRIEPDFIYCRAVLRHVPPDELTEFFDQIMGLAGTGTRLLITGLTAADTVRVTPNSWAHSRSLIRHHVARFGATAEFQAKPGPVDAAEGSKPVERVTIRIMQDLGKSD